jgi:predicted 3-demethylubiquinone-9 3-methyltransferase (glyoxalase superfamily)
MAQLQKITPCLWFGGNADEAVKFYTSIFANSRTVNVSHYGEGAPMPKGSVLVIEFELEGQRFWALNGPPQFQFTEAVSMVVNCETQAEIDRFWEKLSDGGATNVCGWLKDRFGLSWQVVPSMIGDWLTKDPESSNRVLQAVMRMTKLDIAELRGAYEGRTSSTA